MISSPVGGAMREASYLLATCGPMHRALGWGLVLGAGLLLAPAHAQDASEAIPVELRDSDCPAGSDTFCILPDVLDTPTGADLVLRVANRGHTGHNLTFGPDAPGILRDHGMDEVLAPNATITLHVPWDALEEALDGADTLTVTLQCGVPGHVYLGESATLHVGTPPEAEPRPQPLPSIAFVLAGLALTALVVRRRP